MLKKVYIYYNKYTGPKKKSRTCLTVAYQRKANPIR